MLRKGQKLDLSASIQAPDDAVLTWKFNNTPLEDERAESSKTPLKATMSLSSVVKSDEGKYQLVIESSTLGKATGEWSLKVLGKWFFVSSKRFETFFCRHSASIVQ